MSDMYKRIDHLCKTRGTNVTAMCRELKIARSSLSELNAGRTKSLSSEYVSKIADYFKVSSDYLLGNTDDPSPIEAKKEAPLIKRDAELLRDFVREKLGRDPTPEESQKLLDYVEIFIKSMDK